MAFSPVGHILVLGLGDGPIRLWDTTTGRELPPLGGRSVGTTSALFSPDGRLVAFGSFDGTIKIWDAASGRELRVLGRHAAIVHLDRLFARRSRSRVRKRRRHCQALGRRQRAGITDTGRAPGQVISVAFSPDGRMLATGSGDQTVKLWDTAGGNELRSSRGHSAPITSVAFSPDGRVLASGGGQLGGDGVNANNAIKLWDVASGAALRTLIGHSAWVTAVAFSRDGKLLASASGDRTVKLWDTTSGREQRTLGGFLGRVSSLASLPMGACWRRRPRQHDQAVRRGHRRRHSHPCKSRRFSSVRRIRAGRTAAGQRELEQHGADLDGSIRQGDCFVGGLHRRLVARHYAGRLLRRLGGKGRGEFNVRVGARVFAIASYRDKFYRPDLLRVGLAGRSLRELGFAGIDSVKVAPIVELVDLPDSSGDPKLKVNVRITDGGGGIGQVRLFLNGSAVVEDNGTVLAGSSSGGLRSYTVALADGANVLQAEAYNADNSMHSNSGIARIR